MSENGISQEAKDKLALRRSMVRTVMSYVAIGLVTVICLWGLMWMGDRTLAQSGLTTASIIVAFWFGERAVEKKNDK